MVLAKAVIRGVLLLGSVGTAAQAGPMLVLGVFSNQSSPTPPTSVPDASLPVSGDSSPVQFGMFSSAASTPSYNPTPAPTYTPTPSYSPAPSYSPTPSYSPAPISAFAPQSSINYDATINFGSGSFPNAQTLTTGQPSAWYQSQPVMALYGGLPNGKQQADFENAVIQRVGQTFRNSGISVSLTDDLNVQTAHTLSVVGNSSNPNAPQVIGMTYLGGSGFHFIDQSAPSAGTVDQLEWIVAHNISHELMLAFGVPEIHDATGKYIDARDASWAMMIDPNARFSDGAAADLLSRNFRALSTTASLAGAQYLDSQTVPEPATFAAWALGLGTVWVWRRGRGRKA